MNGEWSASSKDGFCTVEKASGKALDIMLGHRAQAVGINERSLPHQELNLDSFSFCCHPACGVVPVLTKQSRFHKTKVKNTQICGFR
jgi:hypothetical protein